MTEGKKKPQWRYGPNGQGYEIYDAIGFLAIADAIADLADAIRERTKKKGHCHEGPDND